MPLKIRAKLIMAFLGIIFPFLLIVGIISIYNLSIIYKGIHKIEKTTEQRAVVTDLRFAIEGALMPGNDYIITGDRKYIDDFQNESKGVEERIAHVEEIFAHPADIYKANEKMEILKDTKNAWQNIKGVSLKIFEIPELIGNRDASRLMEEMDYKWGYPAIERLKRWRKIDMEEYNEAREMSEKAWRQISIIMVAGSVLLVALGVSFGMFYSKLFVKPIETLHNSADAIAGGDFKSRVDVKTGDELEQLANGMNEMAEKLDNFYGTLENQVMERTRELKESEERYRTMIESANDMIWTLTPDRRFTFANKQAEDVSGHSSEEWLGKTFEPLIQEDDLPMTLDIHEKVMKGEKVHYEVRVKKRDGGIRKLSVNASPIFKDGKVNGTISFGRDITEQKQSEAAFRALVGTAVANVGSVFFRETVSSLCTYIGVECVIVSELVDGGMVRALAMQLDGKAVEHYEYALAGTPCESATQKGYCEYHEGVVQLFPADKDLVDIRAEAYIGTPIRDKNGKVNGILCAISRHKFVPPPMVKEVFAIIAARAGSEIERKKVEAAVEESEERFRTISETVADALICMRSPDVITLWNKSAERMFGYTSDEVMGKDLHDIIVPERYREKAREGLKGFFVTGTGPVVGKTVELFSLRKDGSEFPVELSISSMRIKDEWQSAGIVRDISERKKAEEEIRSISKFPSENPNPIFRIGQDATLLYINEAGLRLLPEWHLETGQPAPTVLRDGVLQSIENGAIKELLLEYCDRMYSFLITPVVDAGYANLYSRDITELKKAEEALRDSEERFRQLFDAGNDAVFVHGMTPDGKPANFIEVNETACRRLGYTREELLKMSPLDIDAPEMANQRAGVIDDFLSNKKATFEMVHVAKDGMHIPVEISARLFELKGQQMALSIARDITDRKKAEEEIKRQRDRAQMYLDVAGVMFVAIDPDERIILVNKKGCEVLGYGYDEIVGRNWFNTFIPEISRGDVKGVFSRLISGDVGYDEYFENAVLRKDGGLRIIAWHNTVIRNEAGDIVTTLSSGEDITERKKAEDEVKKNIDELERFQKITVKREFRIKELNDEVKALKLRLEFLEKK